MNTENKLHDALLQLLQQSMSHLNFLSESFPPVAASLDSISESLRCATSCLCTLQDSHESALNIVRNDAEREKLKRYDAEAIVRLHQDYLRSKNLLDDFKRFNEIHPCVAYYFTDEEMQEMQKRK